MQRPDLPTGLGLALLLAYGGQAAAGASWGSLGELQAEESFRRWSGAAAAALVALQWLHPLLRGRGSASQQASLSAAHRWLGCAVVLAFFIHSAQPGAGYLGLLSLSFGVGLLAGMGQTLVEPGSRKAQVLLVGHVLLSVLLVALLLFHAWAVFAYSPGNGVR